MTDIYIYMMIGDTDSQVIMWLYYSLMVNTFVIYHQFHSSS
ncbi:phage integrase domain protein [Escherichia coli 4-203-08_S1_C1]|nr:phage integrase domain protein [Escherichia coli 1-176-05_S1_C3]EZK21293.1 phage integrase domain protein [Escherichia coli 1-176-05_S1_C2]KDU60439.1 phage integrase domain protein [Escherichia coli 4-203-08_S1_C1]KEK91877.1 phage integrase domain protein [Escherichia coli 4-203-08_S1_C2]KEK96837.1 phage integrase domain protein [Escherichia coli 4-203-08_S1_C3]